MKKYLILSITLAIVACSKSNEQKAQDNIKEYTLKHVNDPQGYESVEFGKLDTVYDFFYETPVYKSIKVIQDSVADLLKQTFDEFPETDFSDNAKELKEKLRIMDSLQVIIDIQNLEYKKLRNEIDSLDKIYVPKFKGYSMTHSFRAKGLLGLVLNKYKYTLDSNFVVLKMRDTSE